MRSHTGKLRILMLICLSTLLVACASTSMATKDKILGAWVTEINGFPMDVLVTESEVSLIGFADNIPYKLEDNVISFDLPGQGAYIANIEFSSNDEMIQVPVGGIDERVFKRKK